MQPTFVFQCQSKLHMPIIVTQALWITSQILDLWQIPATLTGFYINIIKQSIQLLLLNLVCLENTSSSKVNSMRNQIKDLYVKSFSN